MHTHLKERKYYEDRYDSSTVSICRSQESICVGAYHDAKKELKPLTGEDKDKDPEHELTKVFNLHYYFMVEWTAGERWEKRSEEIQKMIDADEAKDTQIASARLTTEPICMHCNKTVLRIIDKSLTHRGENYKYDDPEEVLIMLECSACKKRSAYWQDGELWERLANKCPKCSSTMKETSSRKNKVITTTYSCPGCKHSYKDELDLEIPSKKETKPDPDYQKDKARFCLSEAEGQKYLDARKNMEDLKSLMADIKERDDNKHVYDAVKEMKKPKIAELSTLLSPALKKAGYIEFSLDKPEIGKDVFVGFSCLDSKSGRSDNESRKTLKKLVDTTLEETNWRLMSDGISYRLGYLSGRLRAYEREEDLKNLVTKSKKLISKLTKNESIPTNPTDWRKRTFKTPDVREVIL